MSEEKELTAEERAKEVHRTWCQCSMYDSCPMGLHVERQITQACEAARWEGEAIGISKANKLLEKRGFLAGIEAAAKLKEDSCICARDGSAGCCGTCEDWLDARAIRALTPAPKETV